GNASAFRGLVGRTGIELPQLVRFSSQAGDDQGNIPDLIGSDATGAEPLVVENKFWAGLTEHQAGWIPRQAHCRGRWCSRLRRTEEAPSNHMVRARGLGEGSAKPAGSRTAQRRAPLRADYSLKGLGGDYLERRSWQPRGGSAGGKRAIFCRGHRA